MLRGQRGTRVARKTRREQRASVVVSARSARVLTRTGLTDEGDGVAAKWLFWFSVLVSASITWYAITRPIEWLVRVVPDDAFYYLKTAGNIARAGRSSFDGTNPTNGYHPGWMVLVVVLANMFHGKVALLR